VFGLFSAFLAAAHALTMAVHSTLAVFLGPVSAAATIAFLTLAARVLTLPLSYLQVRGEKIRARLAPQLYALRERYGHNPERLVAKTRELYAREGASPFAGCLPALAQAPMFTLLYTLFTVPEIDGSANALLALPFAGTPLGSTLPRILASGDLGALPVFAALLAALAAVAWANRRWLTLPALSAAPAAGQPTPVPAFVPYLPFLTVVIAAFVPLASGIYLVTSTTWTVVERLTLRRLVRVD